MPTSSAHHSSVLVDDPGAAAAAVALDWDRVARGVAAAAAETRLGWMKELCWCSRA